MADTEFSSKHFIGAIAGSLLLQFLIYYFELPALYILIGFRIYIPFIPLWVYLFFYPSIFNKFKLLPAGLPRLLLVVTLWGVSLAAGYLSGYLEFTEPDFMYELGFTSIIDFPVYTIWNSLFLLTPFLFINSVPAPNKWKRFFMSLLLPLFFGGEIYHLFTSNPVTADYIYLAAIVIGFSVLISNAGYIVSYLLTSYSIVWLNLIAFGTGSQFLLNVFLASKYKSWEGFFEGDDTLILISQIVLSIFGVIITLRIKQKNAKPIES